MFSDQSTRSLIRREHDVPAWEMMLTLTLGSLFLGMSLTRRATRHDPPWGSGQACGAGHRVAEYETL
jgi:hypothetical protein